MAEGVSIRLFRNFLIAEGTYKITARRTQTGEDKIAVVINLATRVQQAFFDELSETIFNLIGGITRELDGLVVGRIEIVRPSNDSSRNFNSRRWIRWLSGMVRS